VKSLQLSPRREGCKFTLVKLSAGCYNKNRKNAPGGIFPKFTVIFSITAHLARLGGYFFLSIAKIYPVATMSNTIAPISDISAHPLSGERHRLLLGTFHRYYMEHIEQMSNMFYIISPHRKRDCCTKLENFMQQSLVIMSAVSLQAPLPPLAVPLPRDERSTSSNHTSLTLVFLGHFPIRPVSQSASSYGLASWTGQQRGRLELWHLSFPRQSGGAVNLFQSHFAFRLVFLGGFPIRPVTRSAAPFGLASRTGQ